MSKTNSNSITSIFTTALNGKTSFRREVLKIFEEKIFKKGSEKHIDPCVVFYDCTHTPLLYKEMKGAEIDIIARVPGEHKPVLMIEIKAGTRERLQKSQEKNKAYEKTARNHGIPLIYIIPENYNHKKDIPDLAKKITWETIQERAGNMKVSFDTQISNFVEVSEARENINDDEKNVFFDRDKLLLIKQISKLVLCNVEKVLNSKNRKKNRGRQEDQWGIGHYYDFNGICYFFGINPLLAKLENGKYFLSLAITEDCKNTDFLEKNHKHIYFDDGYFYISILQDTFCAGDEVVLIEIRKKLKEALKHLQLNNKLFPYLYTFYSLRSKIGEDKFDELFNEKSDDNSYEYTINEKVYAKLAKIVKK